MSLVPWDIETTVHQHMKRKASPFTPVNWVVTHGFKKDGKVIEHRFGKQRPGGGWLKPVLVGAKVIAGFNIKFDLLHALQDPENLDAWMEYVAEGGMVWDCQLAEYLLCGMGPRHQMLSLDEVAPRYGGNIKVDEVKALWAAGVMTEDIEPALLSRYLCGGKDEHGVEQLGDVENTEKIAFAQIKRARDCGQLNSILLNMGSLLCTIEMERNGMYVDKALGLKLAAELKAEVDRLHAALQMYLPLDLPFKFNWNSTRQKSALIFGGTVGYEAYEYDLADGTTMLKAAWDKQPFDLAPRRVYAQMDEVHFVMQDGTTRPKVDGEFDPDGVVRYASGKNAGEAKTKKVKVDNLDKPKGRMVTVPYTFPRITDPKPQWAGETEGVWSTSSEVIEELGNRNIPFLKALSELAAATKDLGTYFIVTDEESGESKGMLTLVDEHGIIHHSINHTSTVTGRFSSSNPNLQNIPKGNKSKVKYVFVSRFGPDGKIIQSDFTALEIYVQAILTKCKQLILDLKAGLDMHVLRLSNSPAGAGKTYEELLLLCKGKGEVEPVKEWEYKRTDSKVYSFQAAYGAGDAKIADTTGMDINLVAQLREADDKRYPEIKKYFEARTEEIKRNRKPFTTIPHPWVRGVMCNLGSSSVRTPDGKLYSYTEEPSPEYLIKRGVFSSFSPTQIKNYEVQGEGGEWAKAAMWLAVRAFYKRKNFGGLALLVNQVHDALYSDAHASVADEAAAVLHACMESASDFMEYQFGWTVPVPVPTETKYGPNMMEEVNVQGVRERAQPVRVELRKLYMKDYQPSFLN
jgi:DNA polymerase I-like protein with 3'-5' exonuclease and polymerase domains